MRYDECLPASPELRSVVTAYWHVTGDGSNFPPSSVLPDGHVEIVLNLGDPVALAGPAYTGDQPARTVVGLLSHTISLKYRGRVNMFGIRLHPARGAGFLGHPATALVDKLAPLANICPALDNALAAHTTDTATLDRILLDQLPRALPSDPQIMKIVNRLAMSSASVAELARELGISVRQLQRRFLAAVGIPPKRFIRVIRFARVWQVASMQPEESWSKLAAEHGFADQAHMVREFHAFGAAPPTRVFTPDWYDATTMSRVSGPAEGVRSVQDSRIKPAV